MVVIERTPERHAIREPDEGAIFVTNDYPSLSASDDSQATELQHAACYRRKRIQSLVQSSRLSDLSNCLDYLNDDSVRMNVTVQQMAFHPRTGDFELRIP